MEETARVLLEDDDEEFFRDLVGSLTIDKIKETTVLKLKLSPKNI